MAGPGTTGAGRPPRAQRAPVDEEYYDDEEDGYRRRHPSAGAVAARRIAMFVVGLLVIAAVFACAYFAMMLTSVPSDITVPNLIGKQYSDAEKLADQQHFQLVQAGHQDSDTFPQGAIYQQTPMPGRSIKAGKDVSVFVSDGPSLLPVPDLSQMTLTKAKAVLQDSGLPVGSINYQYDNIVPAGIVTTQEPVSGAHVARDTAVNLTVSKGPQPPPAPSGLSATSSIPNEIDLNWDSVSTPATYNVYRDGKKIASALPETSYSDVNVGDASPHSYTVTAVNGNGESPQSQPATATAAQPGGGVTDQAAIPGTPPDQIAPPLPSSGGAPKQRQFEVRFRVPRTGDRHNIQIEVQDTTGTNIVYDEDRYRGEIVDDSFTGFGNKIVIRIFIDGKLVKQETK